MEDSLAVVSCHMEQVGSLIVGKFIQLTGYGGNVFSKYIFHKQVALLLLSLVQNGKTIKSLSLYFYNQKSHAHNKKFEETYLYECSGCFAQGGK